jgi:hypothetical protein
VDGQLGNYPAVSGQLQDLARQTAFAESDPKPLAPAPSVLANLNGQIAVLFNFSDKPTELAIDESAGALIDGRLILTIRQSGRGMRLVPLSPLVAVPADQNC